MKYGYVMVVGGAGYIGGHVTRILTESGYPVIVFDNLSTGFRQSLIHDEPLIVGDIHDTRALDKVFNERNIETVFHFAASIIAPESVEQPLKYYSNNTCGTINLLTACAAHGVKNFIFSSTAAVYGNPPDGIAAEDTIPNPINPYGSSKLFSERVIADVTRVNNMRYAILRYFNVAGADPNGRMGQRTPNATHLLKVCCEAAIGMRDKVEIFGTDYPTSDGTGVRDYIHVEDLAQSHLSAMKYLHQGGASVTVNVGYGRGCTVREVIESVKNISRNDFPVVNASRRVGDPPRLIACADKIRSLFQWDPLYDSLDRIVADALRWERTLHGLEIK